MAGLFTDGYNEICSEMTRYKAAIQPAALFVLLRSLIFRVYTF